MTYHEAPRTLASWCFVVNEETGLRGACSMTYHGHCPPSAIPVIAHIRRLVSSPNCSQSTLSTSDCSQLTKPPVIAHICLQPELLTIANATSDYPQSPCRSLNIDNARSNCSHSPCLQPELLIIANATSDCSQSTLSTMTDLTMGRSKPYFGS